MNRSKRAERDRAAHLASIGTVHERATWWWICRIAGASRWSAHPRSRPGGASAIDAAGQVDVLVNNTGVGVIGVFEATPMTTVREVVLP